MMSHFDKLEQFHKSIRKQELKNFFSHKRIQLLNSHECTSIDEEVNFQDINTATLKHLAIICQTEQGIDKICNLRVDQQLEKYLASEYINTNEQRLATFIISNLYFIQKPCPPCSDFTSKIVNLLEFGSFETASNIVRLIFNIAHDHPQWRQNIVTSHNICSLLCKRFESQKCTNVQIVNILCTLLKITQGQFTHDSFKELIYIMVNFFNNPACNDRQIISHAFFCFYQLALKFPQEAICHMSNRSLFSRMLKIAKLLQEVRFIKAALQLIQIMITTLSCSDIENQILMFVDGVMRNGYKGGNKQIKRNIYTVLIMILEENKMTSNDLMSHKVGQMLVEHFSTEEDSDVLHVLVHLFSTIITNIDISPLASYLLLLLERVQQYCPQDIEVIGFAKQIIYKVKQKHELHL